MIEDTYYTSCNERMGHLFDAMDIKRIKKEYCEQSYAHQFDILDEIGQFIKYTLCQNSPNKG